MTGFRSGVLYVEGALSAKTYLAEFSRGTHPWEVAGTMKTASSRAQSMAPR